jgi:hypothetical protein
MAKRRTIPLAVLFLVPVALSAGPPPEASVERKRVELRIANLEDRLELSPVIGEASRRERQLVLAASNLELARKLLQRGNLRAAEVVAAHAERALERAGKKGAQQ